MSSVISILNSQFKYFKVDWDFFKNNLRYLFNMLMENVL